MMFCKIIDIIISCMCNYGKSFFYDCKYGNDKYMELWDMFCDFL